jgi:hypothetical protein
MLKVLQGAYRQMQTQPTLLTVETGPEKRLDFGEAVVERLTLNM